jgi:hypothetical protein
LSTLAGSETLTNKTLTAPVINSGTATDLTGLSVRNGSFTMELSASGAYTANRTLGINLNDAGRTLNLAGNLTTQGGNVTFIGTGIADFSSGANGDIFVFNTDRWIRLAAGTSGQYLKTNGAGSLPSWATPSGSGDVLGPGSSTDNAVVRFNGTGGGSIQNSGVIIADDNTILTPTQSTEPAAPAAGNLLWYPFTAAGKPLPGVRAPTGSAYLLQSMFVDKGIAMWLPETSTTIRTIGMPVTSVGTVSTPTLATGSLLAGARRWRVTSAATANAAAENRSAQTMVYIGDAAGRGGFTLMMRVAFTTQPANYRGFFGLLSATGATSTSQVPSALTNCLGFAWDSAETTIRWQHNDGAGTATRVDLGANFPTNSTTAIFSFWIHCDPNGSTIYYRCTREDTGNTTSGSVTTDIPANTTFLTPHLYQNNGGSSAATSYDCLGTYLESDF